jgi:formylglycine-generating enzyme required for sulfatase activity
MKLVLIPPGEFAMGSPQSLIQEDSKLHGGESWRRGTLPADAPQHRVKITNPFWLGATAVTQEEYQRVMGSNPSKFPGDPKKPVEQVSWYDAVEFCRKLSGMTGENAAAYRYELPTEAQWEYACRAGNLGPRYFSDRANPLPMAIEEKMLGEYAWCGDARGQTHPAGQKRANPWGLYDMYGNVWQWCQDWFDKDYYEKSPTDEPVGPPGGAARVRRGGGWDSPPSHCRSAYREGIAPKDRSGGLGFRVCQIPISP